MLRFGGTAVLLGVSLAVAAVGFEMLVRLRFPAFDPSGQVQLEARGPGVPPLGRPGTASRQTKNTGDYDVSVAFNAYGFRDRRDTARASTGALFVVGDSFSFGWGVEEHERYSSLLERQLGIEAYNVSAPSAGIEDYGRLLRYARGLGAPVRHVVVGVCMENDLGADSTGLDEPTGVGLPGLGDVKDALARRSALYFAFTSVVQQNARLRRLGRATGLIAPTEVGWTREPSRDLVDDSASRLEAVVRGLDAVVLVIPSRGLWQGPGRQSEDWIHRRFVAELRSRGLRVVDLRPVFESAARTSPLEFHFAHDGHWNSRGHALAAQALAAEPAVRAMVPQ